MLLLVCSWEHDFIPSSKPAGAPAISWALTIRTIGSNILLNVGSFADVARAKGDVRLTLANLVRRIPQWPLNFYFPLRVLGPDDAVE
jgi:hypothetical protein